MQYIVVVCDFVVISGHRPPRRSACPLPPEANPPLRGGRLKSTSWKPANWRPSSRRVVAFRSSEIYGQKAIRTLLLTVVRLLRAHWILRFNCNTLKSRVCFENKMKRTKNNRCFGNISIIRIWHVGCGCLLKTRILLLLFKIDVW